MKAKELDANLFPKPEVVKAYEAVGQEYERTIQDRVYEIWHSLVAANPVKNQEIEQRITQLYSELYGHDWQGNRKDFTYLEGIIEGMPEFEHRIDPSTNAIIPGSTLIQEVKPVYTIPFSKQRIEDLSQYFTANPSFVLKDKTTSKRYICSRQEFTELGYEELLSLKTGFTEFMNMKRGAEKDKRQNLN